MHTASEKAAKVFVQENMESFESVWIQLLLTSVSKPWCFDIWEDCRMVLCFAPTDFVGKCGFFSLSGIGSNVVTGSTVSWDRDTNRDTGRGFKLCKMSILESNSSIWMQHKSGHHFETERSLNCPFLWSLNYVKLEINILIINVFTLSSLICTFIKSLSNWVKKWELQAAHQLGKGGRVYRGRKKRELQVALPYSGRVSSGSAFQFVKYISEIAHFLSPPRFWEITRWWPALFGFVNRLMQAASVDTGFVSHETSPSTDFQGKTFSVD